MVDSDGRAPRVECAVFGLGEAGNVIARDLASVGVVVRAFDPAPVDTPDGVERVDDPASAVVGVDVVLSITASADAPQALRQAMDAMPDGCLYADLATSAATDKRALAVVAADAGLRFVDVALMNAVPLEGAATPALAAGPGAGAMADLLNPCGMSIETVDGEPGAAASRKLLRSVVVKGLAALVAESMSGARAAGLEDEHWSHLVAQVTAMDGVFLRRLVEGTEMHARRRFHEMEAAVAQLDDAGVDSTMTRATARTLQQVAEGRSR